jgi:arsenate reductase-like glutaredoxin family protein
MSMQQIETLTAAYATERDALAALVTDMNDAIEQIKRARLTAIKQAVQKARQAQDELHAAIEAAPELFEKPRTRTLHGVKVGITKQRGTVEIDDEAKVIARIRSLLPKDQAELLIRVRESVHKPAVYDLAVADLKRLGIRITADCDAVVIKSVDSEVDKLVSALLAEEAQEAMENAA